MNKNGIKHIKTNKINKNLNKKGIKNINTNKIVNKREIKTLFLHSINMYKVYHFI